MSDDPRRLTDPYPLDPDEPVTYVTPGGDGSDPITTGARFKEVYGRMLFHRPTDLFLAEIDDGAALQVMICTRLLGDEGFSLDDADEWAFRDWRRWLPSPGSTSSGSQDLRMCEQVVQAALAYRDTGMPIDEAFAWTIRSVSASYAVHLRDNGWNPETYSRLLTLCMQRATRPAGQMEDAEQWVDAPIPSWRALRYLEAGFCLEEALELERRRLAGEDVDSTTDVLRALREPRLGRP